MCGIAGLLDTSTSLSEPDLQAAAKRMAQSLSHRGPDGEGVWSDAGAGIALGHRRLAVVDLSDTGRQPMASADGRWIIAYNGEVYNFPELRTELEACGHSFRGSSDTEVIVEACAEWGVEKTVERLIGMFAFALWDRRERRLFLVRDRLGIKPLYWGRLGSLIMFGSELKALRAHGGHQTRAPAPEIDRDALTAFFRFGYVPAPHTIYRGIHTLEPGCLVELTAHGEPQIRRYWHVREVWDEAQRTAPDLDDREATDELETLLSDAVKRRMIADVPLGAFLSGGIDSSMVVALMQAQSERPVRTFTIGFDEPGYNEAEHAKAVASHLGTDHTELYLQAEQARDVIPALPDYYDEPFADVSQIPTYLVSQLTRRHVTVALSGDGGDELFGGYNRHYWADAVWRRTAPFPLGLRRMAAGAIRSVSPSAWSSLAAALPSRVRPRQLGNKLHKLAAALEQDSPDHLYRRLASQWDRPETIVRQGQEPAGTLDDPEWTRSAPDFRDRMRLYDTATYLPGDILTKVDRASMAVSLEARVPLLDHRVVAFAWGLKKNQIIRDGKGKWLLRQVLKRHVPEDLVERPKMGFAVPVGQWLRGPLRPWAEDLLSEASLARDGLLNPAPIRQAWAAHLSGRYDLEQPLWAALMFQAWRQRWM